MLNTFLFDIVGLLLLVVKKYLEYIYIIAIEVNLELPSLDISPAI